MDSLHTAEYLQSECRRLGVDLALHFHEEDRKSISTWLFSDNTVHTNLDGTQEPANKYQAEYFAKVRAEKGPPSRERVGGLNE